MPDRFANGNPANDLVPEMNFPVGATRENLNLRHGGDLKGIADHINYLDSLGVTAVWLNPVLENDMPYGSYHGYATTDYYKVDRRLGTNADYRQLIDTLHNHGIKTVMDMIFNHSGDQHPWFKDRPSADWYNLPEGYEQTNYRLSTVTDPYASDYDKRLTVDGWFVKEMPDLNQHNPHLMKYLTQNSIWWIEEAQIDGIRMDTYSYADRGAMAGWADAVLSEYPDFNIVGECWFAEPAGEAVWQAGSRQARAGEDTHLPTVMDFPLMIKSRGLDVYKEQTDPWNGLNKIYDHLALDFIYADPLKLLRFLDNHDTERVLLEEPETSMPGNRRLPCCSLCPAFRRFITARSCLWPVTANPAMAMCAAICPAAGRAILSTPSLAKDVLTSRTKHTIFSALCCNGAKDPKQLLTEA